MENEAIKKNIFNFIFMFIPFEWWKKCGLLITLICKLTFKKKEKF